MPPKTGPAPAPSVPTFQFTNNIVTPLAQVTVVDADEGDCNVVDFCRLPLPNPSKTSAVEAFEREAWYRTIIDTGPGKAAILRTLKLLALQQPLPLMASETAASTRFTRVRALQITHPDNDHIGNADAFLTQMCSAEPTGAAIGSRYIDRIWNCNITYCAIPEKFSQPIITPSTPIYQKVKGVVVNSMKFTAELEEEWQRRIQIAGIIPVVTLRAVDSSGADVPDGDANFAADGYYWEYSANVCTIIYTEAKTEETPPFAVKLKASVRLFFQGDRNLEAKLGPKPKKGTKKPVTAKELDDIILGQAQLMLNDATLAKFVSDATYTLELFSYQPPTKKKKNKRDEQSQTTSLMSNMVRRKLVSSSTRSVVTGAASDRERSVQDIMDLGTTIGKLNGPTYTFPGATGTMRPQLIPRTPDTNQILCALSDSDHGNPQFGYQRILGPTEVLYGNMMREIMLGIYFVDSLSTITPPEPTSIKLDGATTNRSSVVTVFERPDAPFNMLFTGDAFDMACDIRDTLLSWQMGMRVPNPTPPTINVDVLKIPHHGSDTTVSSGFYAYVRANTYLICGSHWDSSGNPKLSTLETIVKGFKGKTAPGSTPFRIFFSNVEADVDYVTANTRNGSCVLAIRAGNLAPGKNLGDPYYYRMYKPAIQADQWASFATIGFGKNSSGDTMVEFNNDPTNLQWKDISFT